MNLQLPECLVPLTVCRLARQKRSIGWWSTQFAQKKNALELDKIRHVNDFDTNTSGAQAKILANSKGSACVYVTKDSFITQDRNEHIEGGTHEATFSRGHSLTR